MNTLREDLDQPLDKVQRAWIRRPTLLILLVPFAFIAAVMAASAAVIAVIDLTVDLFKDCWNVEVPK